MYNGKMESSKSTYEMKKRNTALDCLPIFYFYFQKQSLVSVHTGIYGTTVTYAFLFVDDDTDLYNTAYAYNTGRNYSMFKMMFLLMSASNGVVNSSRSLL